MNAFKVYFCWNCGAEFNSYQKAVDCTASCVKREPEISFVCSVCSSTYETKKEANICCLPRSKQVKLKKGVLL